MTAKRIGNLNFRIRNLFIIHPSQFLVSRERAKEGLKKTKAVKTYPHEPFGVIITAVLWIDIMSECCIKRFLHIFAYSVHWATL